MIRRSTISHPTAPDSADQVYFDTGTYTSDTGLTPDTTYYYSAWSWLEGSNIWSDTYAHDTATTLSNCMEGDATLNGCVSISDAMFIARYKAGLITFDADQLTCADTTDDGNVSMVDAMHIAQWLVDPEGELGVLFKPLWESPADDAMLHPEHC